MIFQPPNTVPFALKGRQVDYVCGKLQLANLEYVGGILYVPEEREQEVYDMVKDYKALLAAVDEWERLEKSYVDTA
ncbi:hypothetical protein EVB87_268 [Rhizobium phage RHph_N28_1]|nr:hypothetical protein EVB87_268 [Rhizobium phage RHph_N28_1]QIG74297.1 hypothetical protein EVC07_269 [Rhizobium phage RHph_N42]QXV73956.1 hypothetical protein [Rhizobium phage RHph_N46]